MISSSFNIASNIQFCITKLKSYLISKKEAKKRLNNTIKAYNLAKKLLLITQTARLYIISKTTLYCSLNSPHDQALYEILK